MFEQPFALLLKRRSVSISEAKLKMAVSLSNEKYTHKAVS